MQFFDTRNKNQKNDPRPVTPTMTSHNGTMLHCIGIEDGRISFWDADQPQLIFHSTAEAVDFFRGLEEGGLRINADITLTPLDQCSGCGKLRASPYQEPHNLKLLCPDCKRWRAEKEEEKRFRAEQKRRNGTK